MCKKRLLFLVIFIATTMNACTSGVSLPFPVNKTNTSTATSTRIPTNTPLPSSTPTNTVTPTPTKTLLPTIDKHPPTPTLERGVEWDLNPFYDKNIDLNWLGVNVKANLLIDDSLAHRIKSLEIPDYVLADLVSRSVFVSWYARRNYWHGWPFIKNSYSPYRVENGAQIPDGEYEVFLDLWAKAQETGDEQDWRKVQINEIWANDLTDNNGFVQQPYNIWPMHEGETPAGVRGIEQVTIVFVKTSSVTNINNFAHSKEEHDLGFGVNIDNENMVIYLGYSYNPEINTQSIYKPKTILRYHLGELLASVGIRLTLRPSDFANEWINFTREHENYVYPFFGDNYLWGLSERIEVEFTID